MALSIAVNFFEEVEILEMAEGRGLGPRGWGVPGHMGHS